MKHATFAFALGFLMLNLAARPALAATSTASFGVSVTVQAACQVSAPARVSGAYATAAANAASSLSVACTNPTPYNVKLSAGQTASAVKKTSNTASVQSGSALLAESASGASADSITITVIY